MSRLIPRSACLPELLAQAGQYDTWNRLTSMTYADGEKVTYNYNAGGLLRSMTGKKKGSTFNYVNQLGYDKFGQRVYRSMRLAQSAMANS